MGVGIECRMGLGKGGRWEGRGEEMGGTQDGLSVDAGWVGRWNKIGCGMGCEVR